jgi:hypothetical protein
MGYYRFKQSVMVVTTLVLLQSHAVVTDASAETTETTVAGLNDNQIIWSAAQH